MQGCVNGEINAARFSTEKLDDAHNKQRRGNIIALVYAPTPLLLNTEVSKRGLSNIRTRIN